MDILRNAIPVITPILVCVAVGYLLSKRALRFDMGFISSLVMNVAAPCLIVNTLANLNAKADVTAAAFGHTLLAGFLLIIFALLIGAMALRLWRQPLTDFLPVIAFGNSGNLGLPLAYFALGEAGLGLAIGIFIASTVSQLLAQPLLQSNQKGIKTLFTTPVIYAALIGTVLLAGDIALPNAIAESTRLLGNLTIPLMLVALGHSLSQIRVRALRFATTMALLRLSAGILAGIAVCQLLRLEGITRNVVILQSFMPSAVFTYIMANRYNRSPQEVAGIVFTSTLLVIILFPVLLTTLVAP